MGLVYSHIAAEEAGIENEKRTFKESFQQLRPTILQALCRSTVNYSRVSCTHDVCLQCDSTLGPPPSKSQRHIETSVLSSSSVIPRRLCSRYRIILMLPGSNFTSRHTKRSLQKSCSSITSKIVGPLTYAPLTINTNAKSMKGSFVVYLL